VLESDIASSLPPEMRLTVKSLRIFGHFDDSVFSELYKHIEIVKLEAGQTLFAAGEKDDSMFIVQNGEVRVLPRSLSAESLPLTMYTSISLLIGPLTSR
jgi:CRP-like cAMP-binding protein